MRKRKVNKIAPSWAAINRQCTKLSYRLRNHNIGAIVAVTRGGLIPAGIIAEQLSIRIIETVCISSYNDDDQLTKSTVYKRVSSRIAKSRFNILVVDDICDTGRTFGLIQKDLPLATYCSVFCKPLGISFTSMYGAFIEQECWVTFPWELEEERYPDRNLEATTPIRASSS